MADERSEAIEALSRLLALRVEVAGEFREGLDKEVEDHVHEFGAETTGRLIAAHVEAEVDRQLREHELERRRGRVS